MHKNRDKPVGTASEASPTPKKQSILEEAQELVLGPRRQNYGHPLNNFTNTAQLWSAILGITVTAEQVGLCMIAVKISRQIHAPKRDNLVDIAGYAQTLQLVSEERTCLEDIYCKIADCRDCAVALDKYRAQLGNPGLTIEDLREMVVASRSDNLERIRLEKEKRRQKKLWLKARTEPIVLADRLKESRKLRSGYEVSAEIKELDPKGTIFRLFSHDFIRCTLKECAKCKEILLAWREEMVKKNSYGYASKHVANCTKKRCAQCKASLLKRC